jgi:hypothetical protein
VPREERDRLVFSGGNVDNLVLYAAAGAADITRRLFKKLEVKD